jgi:hypothetical protein
MNKTRTSLIVVSLALAAAGGFYASDRSITRQYAECEMRWNALSDLYQRRSQLFSNFIRYLDTAPGYTSPLIAEAKERLKERQLIEGTRRGFESLDSVELSKIVSGENASAATATLITRAGARMEGLRAKPDFRNFTSQLSNLDHQIQKAERAYSTAAETFDHTIHGIPGVIVNPLRNHHSSKSLNLQPPH